MLAKPPYGHGKPVLEQLFEDAMKKRVAAEIDRQVQERPAILAQISGIVSDGVALLFEKPDLRARLVESVANGIANKVAGR